MKKVAMLFMALTVSSLTYAQTKLSGTVKDETGEPLIGASVVVKGGSGTGAITDLDGNFSIVVPSGKNQVMVSYIGYVSQTVSITGRKNLSIVLKEDKNNLEEVVVVGYGSMKKSDLAGATGSMDEKKMKGSIITNLDQAFGRCNLYVYFRCPWFIVIYPCAWSGYHQCRCRTTLCSGWCDMEQLQLFWRFCWFG